MPNSARLFKFAAQQLGKPLRPVENEEWISQYLDKDLSKEEVSTMLIQANYPLVISRVDISSSRFNYFTPFESYKDAFQEGCMGLLHALSKFDPRQYSNKFTTYATYYIDVFVNRSFNKSVNLVNYPEWTYNAKIVEKKKDSLRRSTKLSLKLNNTFGSSSSYYSIIPDMQEDSINIPSGCLTESAIYDNNDHNVNFGFEYSLYKEVVDFSKQVLNQKQLYIVNEIIVNNRTLVSVGNEFALSKERIRQIFYNSLSKIKEGGFLDNEIYSAFTHAELS